MGSIPHTECSEICTQIASTIQIPAWPQLPRRSFRENMYIQYSPSLPAVVIDPQQEKISFDTRDDISLALEDFYGRYLADDVDSFGLRPEYAAGFYAMLDCLRSTPGEWVKGQVTGPISFGLTVTDQNRRASLYDETLADVIVKNMAMNARWQIRQLHSVRPQVILFVDEPYLASFGSAYINLSREQVTALLNEVFAAIHAEGALAGVHCCGNTDWSVLMAADVDILNLDAFSYMENLSLYTGELSTFIERGGAVAWGIVPTGTEIHHEHAASLVQRLRDGLKMINQKSFSHGTPISLDELACHSLVTTSCGLGSSGMEIAQKALEMLVETGEILSRG
jgi:methionine synthase II (cobalamin-independent)